MREFKFRAWDVAQNEMLSWSQLYQLDRLDSSDRGNTPLLVDIMSDPQNERFKLMQFTGLHDKHGVEIYEGDILLHQSWTDQGNTTYHNVIEYYSGMSYCGFRMKNGRFTKALRRNNILDDVVVGNIYEHSHLLNKKNEQNTMA